MSEQPRPVRPPEHHHDHADVTGGGLRAGIFGAMDGIVSNTALVCGVAAGGASDNTVLLTGLVGMIAGALSMAGGEWNSIQSQNEVTQRELDLERLELARNPASEEAELAQAWMDRGLSAALATEVARELSRDPKEALRIHAENELGIDPGRLPDPWRAAVSSLGAFSLGAFLPASPFIVGGRWALFVGLLLSAVALFAVGSGVARISRQSAWFGGFRQLVTGAVLAAVTYGLGAAIGAVVT